MVLRDTEEDLKTETQWDWGLQRNSTKPRWPHMNRWCKRKTTTPGPGLPPFTTASQFQLPLSPNTPACTYTLTPFSGILLLFSRQKRGKKSESELCQGLQSTAKRDEGRTPGDEQRVTSETNPTAKHRGLTAGSTRAQWEGSRPPPVSTGLPVDASPRLTFSEPQSLSTSASLPRSINRSSWAQLRSVPHLALPFAPTRSERYPATTAAMFSTHVTEVQTTTRGAGTSTACQDGPCSPHLPLLLLLLQTLSSAGFCSSPRSVPAEERKQPALRGACVLLSSKSNHPPLPSHASSGAELAFRPRYLLCPLWCPPFPTERPATTFNLNV